ncbi:YeeE/YedE family protein [Burkholderiaceae bacterium FT117]|uniref:YeeE/YedE family protein n=1 Tax=Zeimonas sediminis TaxID=2944268 RepID=UPI002342C123|nr:YeeE/YedE thiosulfate transporter family protein [Zeimonas sediminis]MCM5571463.1 YeeE/YedE family protein [Zeimonas sediminis]
MEALFPLGVGHYLAGGLIIGLGVSLLFLTTGLIGGMSTVFTSTWSFVSRLPFFSQPRFVDSRAWRLVYAAGLVLGAAAWFLLAGHDDGYRVSIPWWQLAVGGFVAGFGARMSNGCTSGHGICGMGSLQLPSMLAVLTFLATAMVTARLVLMFGGR